MSRNKTTKRKAIGSPKGKNLVVLSGLPRNTFKWIIRKLTRDTSQKSARYVGAPSPENDWRALYRNNITETVNLIEHESGFSPPHRIIVLYVPSLDAEDLLSALEPICFLAPLKPIEDDSRCDVNAIAWRHNILMVEDIVYQALQDAFRSTNSLKAEITDSRISPFTLPAHNFYYPNRHSIVGDAYHDFIRQGFNMAQLKDNLLPERFTRDQLPSQAFKGSQHTDRFFQDCRGRVFPPDLHHAPVRGNSKESFVNGLSLVLRQRYRFGVTVRDGNLHYDVQYETPKRLQREQMCCAEDGHVLVTGSHANVGVNDVIWVPNGEKQLWAFK